jgi:hypothetical protein
MIKRIKNPEGGEIKNSVRSENLAIKEEEHSKGLLIPKRGADNLLARGDNLNEGTIVIKHS